MAQNHKYFLTFFVRNAYKGDLDPKFQFHHYQFRGNRATHTYNLTFFAYNLSFSVHKNFPFSINFSAKTSNYGWCFTKVCWELDPQTRPGPATCLKICRIQKLQELQFQCQSFWILKSASKLVYMLLIFYSQQLVQSYMALEDILKG